MAAQVAADVEKQSGKLVMIEAAIMQRVLETHVREQLEALADLRVSLDEEDVGLCANLNSLDMVTQMTDKSPAGKAGAVQNQWHLQ